VKPRVRYETLPDGRRVERIEVGGPRVSKRVVTPADDRHPETNREEAIVTETYAAEDVAEWAAGLGREGERGKIDGAVVGEFPRKSRLAAAMVEAGLDADALAAKVLLPVELIHGLIETGEVPGDDQRRQLESVVPDPFPESGELIEPTPNEINGDAIPAERERHRGEPAPTRGEAETRSKRRAQLAAEVRSEADRRAAAASRRDAARLSELDRGLTGIARRLRRIGKQ
jgi:hypothetical protein